MNDSPYDELRPLLFSIAYRMLASVAEAEDVVQEAFLRLHQATSDGTRVQSPKAFLTTVTTRLAIDHLRSARNRREAYVGPWLPDPLVADDGPSADVAAEAELADSLSMGFMLLLEQLNPVERAVFVLREAFELGYDEIGAVVDKTEDNCRQIAARARRRLEGRTPRFEASHARRDALADRFLAACREGELEPLVELLADDAVFHGDGGGQAVAFSQPIDGRERVARLVRGVFGRVEKQGLEVRRAEVNGQPGAVFLDPEERLIAVWSLEVGTGGVHAIRSVINPDKLGHIGPVSDAARLPPGRRSL